MRTDRGMLKRCGYWALAGMAVVGAVWVVTALGAEDTADFAVYDYSEMDEGHEKAVRLAIATDLQFIRGLLVSTNASTRDTWGRSPRQPVALGAVSPER